MVIFLRYKSLKSDAEPWLTATEVYRRTGVKMCSQWQIIKRWKANGYIIAKKARPPRPRKLTPEQEQWLVSPETLQDMSHLSLKRRCEVIKERLGLASFADHTLWAYYRRLKVKYKRPDYRFWKSLAENRRLKEEQHAFVVQLGTLINCAP